MSIRLKKIKFHNYKCFRNKEIQFQKYNSLVGVNGIGKSTILDGIFQITKIKLEPKTKNNQARFEEKQSIHYFFELIPMNDKEIMFSKSEFHVEIDEEGIQIIDLKKVLINNSFIKIKFIVQDADIINFTINEITSKLEMAGLKYYIPNKKSNNFIEMVPMDFKMKNNSNSLSKLLRDLKEFDKMLLNYIEPGQNIILMIGEKSWKFYELSRPDFNKLTEYFMTEFLQNINIIYLDNKLASEPINVVYNFTDQSDSFGILRVFREFNKNSVNIFKEIDYASRSNYIETVQKDINRFMKNTNPPINEFQFEFQYVKEDLGILIRDSNKKLINFDFLSSGQQWLIKFILYYYTQLKNINKKNNEKTLETIILIDEPGQTLHPKAQKVVAEYLQEFSKQNQIIFATHFHDLLNYNDPKSIILLKKDINNQIITKDFPVNNKLFVLDILKTIEPLEAASIISQSNYKLLEKKFMKEISECSMVKSIHEEVKNNPNEIKNLGTKKERYDFRVIHDAQFLTTLPKRISSNQKYKKDSIRNIFLFQIIKNRGERVEDHKERFTYLYGNWKNDKKMDVCLYRKKEKTEIMEKIWRGLNINKFSNFSFNRSIFLFPECSLPYDILEKMIEYATINEYIIIAGMEHIKFGSFLKKVEKLKKKYDLEGKITNYPDYNFINANNEEFVNAAAIIWPNENIIFQIKNNPAKGLEDHWEKIKEFPEQTYYIIETHLGNIAVFICKDFLVNYSVLPKWMEINDVDIIAIPSFTPLVGPFLSKLREISYCESNKGKMFLYTNLAEYGGSDILNYEWRHSNEPNNLNNYNLREEMIVDFDLSKKFGKENPKKIKLEN